MEPRGLHRVRPDSSWATKDVHPADGRSPPGAREPLQVGPGHCGPLGGLLLPALAPIQQAQVLTQITVNRCVSLLTAPAAPLTLYLTPRRRLQGAAAVPLPDCTATTPSFQLDCGPKKPLDPARTCRCHCLTLPVLHGCRGEAFLHPGCTGSQNTWGPTAPRARAPTPQASRSP
ncbi:hypothetical protein NDU88_003143 [Pleurodeles waltl]|uniref:Uncharacterized protein n=1 Tax=Pleurodeles waltl TaxID=8319 RepID=A0AAV7PAF5_PLEWA|nr:hypothetical protein NDU88_003143 [Pleurodeles waltl]